MIIVVNLYNSLTVFPFRLLYLFQIIIGKHVVLIALSHLFVNEYNYSVIKTMHYHLLFLCLLSLASPIHSIIIVIIYIVFDIDKKII